MNKENKNARRAIQLLLITVTFILLANFACAQGLGVQILNMLGLVPANEVTERSQILRGVEFMQFAIKIIAILGLSGSAGFALKALHKNSTPLAD